MMHLRQKIVNFFSASEQQISFHLDKRTVKRKNKPNQVRITKRVLSQISSDIATKRPEQGGVLGINKFGVISHFYYDIGASKTSVTYSPDIIGIRPVLDQWKMEDIQFCGMIHSHPGSFGRPSAGDLIYAEQILKAMPRTLNGVMHMPIITVNPYTGTAVIQWYLARLTLNGVRIEKAELFANGRHIHKLPRVLFPSLYDRFQKTNQFFRENLKLHP